MLIDMPLEELKCYQGRNPKPADFDRFWTQSLAELSAIDPDVELSPASFQIPGAECFDLYFTGTGGSRVYVKYARPISNGELHCGVVQFHGYTGNSGDWFGLMPFVAAGMEIMAMDCRGQGGKSQDTIPVSGNTLSGHITRGAAEFNPRKLYFRNVFLDCARTVQLLMNQPTVDPGRVAVTGGSQGGGLSFAAAALVPQVKYVAGAFPFLCDYKRVWEMDLAKNAYVDLGDYFRRFDPLHSKETELFELLGYIDVQHLAPKIQAKALMACAMLDITCPPSTQFAMFNKIPGEKELTLYPDFCHEFLPRWDDIRLTHILRNL